MWTGLAILAALAVAVGAGQWWVTRPAKNRQVIIDGSRRHDTSAELDNPVVRGQGLPPY